MRVRVLEAFAIEHWVCNPGEEIELPDVEAVSFLKAGVVERIASVPEVAMLPERGEKAVRVARAVR